MGYKRKETTNRAYKGLITRTGFYYDSVPEVGQIMGMKDGMMPGTGLYLIVMYDKQKRENQERSIQTSIPVYLYRPYSGKGNDIPLNWTTKKIWKYITEELGWDKLPKQCQERKFIERFESEGKKKLELCFKHLFIPMSKDFIHNIEGIRFVIQERVSMMYKKEKTSKVKDLYIIYSVKEDLDGKTIEETLTPVFIGDDDEITLPLNGPEYGFDQYEMGSDSQYILQSINETYKVKKSGEELEFKCRRKIIMKTPQVTNIQYEDVVIKDKVVYWGDEPNMVDMWLRTLETLTRQKSNPTEQATMIWDGNNQCVRYNEFGAPEIYIDQPVPYDERRDKTSNKNYVKGHVGLPHNLKKIVKVYPVKLGKNRMAEVGFNYYD